MGDLSVSVVIPTYNRADTLRRTLRSLAEQSLDRERFEVLVVDDGSTDNTSEVCQAFDSLVVRYVPQHHGGGTSAKNTGAQAGQGEFLLFLDDDITLVPEFLESLVAELAGSDHLIVAGTLNQVAENPILLRALPPTASSASTIDDPSVSSVAVPFTKMFGGCFSIRRSDFYELGMLQEPAPGCWPNWEDVDLAYRAHLQGFHFRQTRGTVGYHWDRSFNDLEAYARRADRGARTAVLLFKRHPGLRGQLPMFRDKEPISWSVDPPGLIGRKLLRRLVSSSPSVFAMRQVAHVLEKRKQDATLLALLYRWIISAHIYRGYRAGLRDLGQETP